MAGEGGHGRVRPGPWTHQQNDDRRCGRSRAGGDGRSAAYWRRRPGTRSSRHPPPVVQRRVLEPADLLGKTADTAQDRGLRRPQQTVPGRRAAGRPASPSASRGSRPHRTTKNRSRTGAKSHQPTRCSVEGPGDDRAGLIHGARPSGLPTGGKGVFANLEDIPDLPPGQKRWWWCADSCNDFRRSACLDVRFVRFDAHQTGLNTLDWRSQGGAASSILRPTGAHRGQPAHYRARHAGSADHADGCVPCICRKVVFGSRRVPVRRVRSRSSFGDRSGGPRHRRSAGRCRMALGAAPRCTGGRRAPPYDAAPVGAARQGRGLGVLAVWGEALSVHPCRSGGCCSTSSAVIVRPTGLSRKTTGGHSQGHHL